jgi:Ca-activated chloride channel homolog
VIAVAFAEPAWLALLGLVPVWIWLDAARRAHGASAIDSWIGPRRERLAPPAPVAARLRNARAAGAAAVALLVLALARPQWGEPSRRSGASGADVVLCLDVSRSMRARDVAPDRAAAVRAMVRRYCDLSAGDRAALVLFAGSASLRVPSTTDLASLSQIADMSDELDVEKGGTDLAAALDAAALALVGTQGGAVVLLTDGEDRDGRGLAAAQRLFASGVVVHVVAIGGERGARIPVVEQGREDYLRDATGAVVETAPDRVALRAIATAGGGAFVPVDDGATDAVLELRRGSVADGVVAGAIARGELVPPDRFALLLVLAAAASLASAALRRSAHAVRA